MLQNDECDELMVGDHTNNSGKRNYVCLFIGKSNLPQKSECFIMEYLEHNIGHYPKN